MINITLISECQIKLIVFCNVLDKFIVQISLSLRLKAVLQIKNCHTSVILTSFCKKLVKTSHSKRGFLGYDHTVLIVKRSVAESVPDRASVHTTNAPLEAVSSPEQDCSTLLLKMERSVSDRLLKRSESSLNTYWSRKCNGTSYW